MPSFLRTKILPALVASIVLALPLAAGAEALLKPVPVPDTSKLPPDKAAELRDGRVEFEKVKTTLVGEPLEQAYAILAGAYARAGFYDAAAVALENASMLAPNDARWIYAQGLIAKMQKRNDAANGFFERALTLDANYLPIRMAVAGSRVERGDLDGARKVLDELAAKRDNEPIVHAMLGDIALRQRRYAEAIEHTDKALKLDPKATKLYAQLADAYAGAGNAKAAADARAKAGDGVPALGDPIALGLMAQTPTRTTAAPAQPRNINPVDEAAFFVTTRQYDAARAKLDGALKAKPNDAELLALYARLEAAQGNFAQARARADAAVAASPNDAAMQLVAGGVAEMANDDAAARRAYEKAISLDGKLAEARIRLGNLLLRGGRNDEAVAQYRAVVQADAADGEGWSRLVGAQVAAGKCDAALKDVNGGLAKDANNRVLLLLFVRLASTCTAAGAEERRMALDYAGKIYRESESAPVSEAYALALAANGKWDDAVKTQQAAMFILVRNGRRGDLPGYQEVLRLLQAHRMPDKPFASDSPWLKPARLAPDAKAVASGRTPGS